MSGLLLVSCKKEIKPEVVANKEYNKLKKAEWFLGNWENVSEEASLTEKWIVKNDSTYYAETYYIGNGDTLFSEKVDLVQIGSELFFIPTVTNQNDNKGVEFRLTAFADDELIFENPEHDFPKKITYKLIDKDSIFAQISGDGKVQDFPFRRVR